MVKRHQDEVVRCVAAYLQDDDAPISSKLTELYLALCSHASRVLRRHGLRSVEPGDAVTEVLFPPATAKALRPRLLAVHGVGGLEAAVAYLLGAVNNGIWQLHAEQDPVGARAFRSLRVASRLLREDPVGPRIGCHSWSFGDHGHSAVLTAVGVAESMQVLAQRGEFAGLFALRCHRALGSRLSQLLVALHQQCRALGQRLEVGFEELKTALVDILRQHDIQQQRLLALGHRDLLSAAEEVASDDTSWPFSALEAGPARLMASAMQECLGQGRLSQRRLYASRVKRLQAVVCQWLADGCVFDPLERLQASGVSMQVAYEDRALLGEALRAEALQLLPSLCSA
jgi:hypothetical protein